MKRWKPFIFENSKLPIWASFFAPININAISFGLWVWCRGSISDSTRRHETIHFQQQLELLFVFQWVLYGLFWLVGLVKYKNGRTAYYNNIFEKEAYHNEHDVNYLKNRKRYSWWKYKT